MIPLKEKIRLKLAEIKNQRQDKKVKKELRRIMNIEDEENFTETREASKREK